ncbi:MAG: hypothetical protein Q8N51_00640 [Gammaproteobacteria bacterium]|nr:hypothetical protein [Gammaproteobacteria bacterium]
MSRLHEALRRAPSFNGPEYQPSLDFTRLSGQILRVYEAMKDGQWRTLDEIGRATGDPVASVSSQLRHLRKTRFGSHTVNRRSRQGALFEYQLLTGDRP